jgi:hypothetical protein
MGDRRNIKMNTWATLQTRIPEESVCTICLFAPKEKMLRTPDQSIGDQSIVLTGLPVLEPSRAMGGLSC